MFGLRILLLENKMETELEQPKMEEKMNEEINDKGKGDETSSESNKTLEIRDSQSFELQKDPKCLCYSHKKDISSSPMPEKLPMKSEITASNVHKIRSLGHPYRLIDIREQWERDAYHISGDEHILMSEIIEYPFKENEKQGPQANKE